MRVLGDINPNLTAPPDSPVRTSVESRPSEGWERLRRGPNDISDMPLRITDERYRLECDRLREDEEWQEIQDRRPRFSSSVAATAVTAATAVDKPEVYPGRRAIEDAPISVRSVSNDLVQEQRQRTANELFANFGYSPVSPPPRVQPRRVWKIGAPWAAALILALALIGLSGYSYLAMRQNGVSARQLPGVQSAIALDQRLDAAQSRAGAAVQAARDRSEQLIAAGRERWSRWRR